MRDINKSYFLYRRYREIELDTGILTLIFIVMVVVAVYCFELDHFTLRKAQGEMCYLDALY